MNTKRRRLETIRMLISSKELGNQEEVLQELRKEGFTLTQATLSRDLKQLKVAKAASMNGKYVYVLPNVIGIWLHFHTIFWKYVRHQNASGICQQHSIQY